jgi:hypothetical protein
VRGRRGRRTTTRCARVACLLALVLVGAGCGSGGPSPSTTVTPTVTPTVTRTAAPTAAPGTGTGSGSSAGSGETAGGGNETPDGGEVAPGPDVDAAARLAQARRDALRDGLIAYRPPSPMRQGSVQRVVVRASGIEQRGRLLAGFPDASGTVVTTPLVVGLTLSADLAGEGFVVTPIGSGDPARPSLAGDVAEWQWDIQPVESGPKTLTLVVRSFYGDVTTPVAVRYVDAPVLVSWDPWFSTTRLLSSPSWAATGLTAPVLLGAAVAARRRRRKRSLAATADPATRPDPTTATAPPAARSPTDDGDRGYL